MPFYLVQAKYTSEGTKGLIRNPHDRGEIVAKLAEAAGGKLHAFYYAFGDYDAVMIVEAPDNVSAAAAAMTGSAAGGSTIKTTPLLSREEGAAAMRKAGTLAGRWTPPTRYGFGPGG